MSERHRAAPAASDGRIASYEVLSLEGDILKNLTDDQVGIVLSMVLHSRMRDLLVTERVKATGRPHAAVFDEVGKADPWRDRGRVREAQRRQVASFAVGCRRRAVRKAPLCYFALVRVRPSMPPAGPGPPS